MRIEKEKELHNYIEELKTKRSMLLEKYGEFLTLRIFYIMQNAIRITKNSILSVANLSIYLSVFPGWSLVYALNVIRLARDAMSVPTPPILTPSSSSCQLSVNRDSRMAEGTLLMHWQERVDTTSTDLSSRAAMNCSTAGIRAMLPEKMKKHTKVNSRG